MAILMEVGPVDAATRLARRKLGYDSAAPCGASSLEVPCLCLRSQAPLMPTITSTAQAPRIAAETVDVSVVIPCLNESETIATCIIKARRSMERAGLRGEVVVADNGSMDGSPEIAATAGARVVHETRKG